MKLLRSPFVRGALVVLALLALALAWRTLPVSDWVEETVRPAVERAGAWGYLLYFAVYVLAVVLMAPGSPLTLIGGLLFGPVVGLILVSLSSTTGAALAFLVARTIGRGRVRCWAEQDRRFQAIDRAVAERGPLVVLLLRLSPMIPFNVLNYALGLTGVGFLPYVLVSWVGMLPATAVYVFIGASASGRGLGELRLWWWVFIVAATATATLYIGLLARRALRETIDLPAENLNPNEPTCLPDPRSLP